MALSHEGPIGVDGGSGLVHTVGGHLGLVGDVTEVKAFSQSVVKHMARVIPAKFVAVSNRVVLH